MSRKRYPKKFKIAAVKQVTEAGFRAYEVADRLGTTTNSLYNWIRKHGPQSSDYRKVSQESDEIRRLKKELKRVTDERDQLNLQRRTSQVTPSEIRLYQRPCG